MAGVDRCYRRRRYLHRVALAYDRRAEMGIFVPCLRPTDPDDVYALSWIQNYQQGLGHRDRDRADARYDRFGRVADPGIARASGTTNGVVILGSGTMGN